MLRYFFTYSRSTHSIRPVKTLYSLNREHSLCSFNQAIGTIVKYGTLEFYLPKNKPPKKHWTNLSNLLHASSEEVGIIVQNFILIIPAGKDDIRHCLGQFYNIMKSFLLLKTGNLKVTYQVRMA